MTLGPVQLLVVGFEDPKFTGEINEELKKLRENDVIRLIDVLAVTKDANGEIKAVRRSDLSVDEAEDLGAAVGALIGLGFGGAQGAELGAAAGGEAGEDGHLLDQDEMWDVAEAIPNGSAAAIALIEHRWAIPLKAAIARAGGFPLTDAWVHPLDLVAAGLMAAEDLEAADGRGGATTPDRLT
jgi:uncharacterized membrane protein